MDPTQERDGLLDDMMAAIRQVEALVPDAKHARLIRGILERQLVLLSRMTAIENQVRKLAPRPSEEVHSGPRV
jgi:hypothetical protein